MAVEVGEEGAEAEAVVGAKLRAVVEVEGSPMPKATKMWPFQVFILAFLKAVLYIQTVRQPGIFSLPLWML